MLDMLVATLCKLAAYNSLTVCVTVIFIEELSHVMFFMQIVTWDQFVDLTVICYINHTLCNLTCKLLTSDSIMRHLKLEYYKDYKRATVEGWKI